MTKTATARPTAMGPTAAELQEEDAALERYEAVWEAVGAVLKVGGRTEAYRNRGTPLEGIRIDHDGSVTGPRVPPLTAEQVRTRRGEIAAALPAAEAREAEEEEQAQQRAEQEAEQRVGDVVAACRTVAREAEEADRELARARAEVSNAVAASPVGAMLGAIEARRRVAHAFASTLASAGREDAQRRVLEALGDDATAARQTLNMLGGHHHAALRPAERAPLEYDWLIDALLDLPRLRQVVADLSIATQTRR